MKKNEYLFVGGPLDGQRIFVPPGIYRYAHFHKGTREELYYRLEHFAFSDAAEKKGIRVPIFIPESWSGLAAAKTMLDNYGRKQP